MADAAPLDPFVDHVFARARKTAGQLGYCVGSIRCAVAYLEAVGESERPDLCNYALRALKDALRECGEEQ